MPVPRAKKGARWRAMERKESRLMKRMEALSEKSSLTPKEREKNLVLWRQRIALENVINRKRMASPANKAMHAEWVKSGGIFSGWESTGLDKKKAASMRLKIAKRQPRPKLPK